MFDSHSNESLFFIIKNFAKLKSGKVDMLSSAWLPSNNGMYKSDVEEMEPLLELGLHYKPYALWRGTRLCAGRGGCGGR